MYKTIRLPEEIYDEAKLLGSKLEKNKVLAGVHHISLSTAVGFAIAKTLELLNARAAFLNAAGSWKKMKDIESLKETLYRDRALSSREDVAL